MSAKTIHYCWFGGNPKSRLIEKCMRSWKKFFPDFEIKEWNESNFDLGCNTYVKQAYAEKKYAFVSDYARFWALEKYGGLYFDTDVEVVRDFGGLLEDEAFAGFENERYIAPGLVLWAAEPMHPIITEAKKYYETHDYLDGNGRRIPITVCGIFTNILRNHGFVPNNQKQVCGGVTLYPTEYFNPFSDATGILSKTENTYAIHWYSKSWMSKPVIFKSWCTRVIHRLFGVDAKRKLYAALRVKK